MKTVTGASPVNTHTIAALRQGSREAFAAIFEHYEHKLMQYAYTICASTEDAEEVVQDVFISLWNNRSAMIENDITGWLVKVCRNKAIKSLRGHIFKTDIQNIPESAIGDPEDGLQKLYYSEIRKEIQSLINSLPPERKKIFLLSREEGLSHQQIADQLGISALTVKKQISLALAYLRNNISPAHYSLLLTAVILS